MTGRWRDRARTTIERTLAGATGSYAERLTAIDAAYPFGPRAHHPYKVWLEERAKAASTLAAALGLGPIARMCAACGARPFKACKPIGDEAVDGFHGARGVPSDPGPLFGGAP